MKKYFFILAAAAALAACAKNEVTPVLSNENTEIAYNVAPKTKADPNAFPTTNVFASWAYYLPKDKNWDADYAGAEEYIVNSTISHQTTANVWKNTGNTYYWPKEGKLTFFAYSLNKGNLTGAAIHCTHDNGITGTIDLKTNKNTDFLVAEIAKDKTANETVYGFNGVPTLFKHKLSKIVCNVKTEADYANKVFELKSIKFTGISYEGTYGQLPTEAFATGSNKDTQIYTSATQTLTSTFKPVATKDVEIYVPQEFTDETAKIVVDYTITTTVPGGAPHVEPCNFELNLKDKFTDGWKMGKKYTINLTFKLNEILWAPAVEDWTDATDADITIQ